MILHPLRAWQRALPALLVGLLVALVVATMPAAAVTDSAGATPLAWGGNANGQLGDGTRTSHLTPAPVSRLSSAVEIAGGREHVLALDTAGQAWGWGDNAKGQVGDGTRTDRLTPTAVDLPDVATHVETGHYHSLALLADGMVWAWGYGLLGQLGDGAAVNRTRPVQVRRTSGTGTTALTGVVAIAGGRDHSLAVRADGTVWAWGNNSFGEIGDGTTMRRTTAVRVPGISTAVAVGAGRNHSLALLANGTVRAWGRNTSGQLGDGTTTQRTSPVAVSGLTGNPAVRGVAAGAFHSVAVLADGTVRAWGEGGQGQLGRGRTADSWLPVPTSPALAGVVFVGAGRDHTLAVTAGGGLYAWGRNDFGQIGDGTTTNVLRPWRVSGATGTHSARGGQNYTVALPRP